MQFSKKFVILSRNFEKKNKKNRSNYKALFLTRN